MPRLPRTVIPGLPHHVTQRGNNRQDVFVVEDDRRAYLGLVNRHAQRFGLGTWRPRRGLWVLGARLRFAG